MSDSIIVTAIEGLVAMYLAEFRDPDKLVAALARREELADVLASGADVLVEPRAIHRRDERRERQRVLNAAALAIALGMHTGGAVDWAGRHWCRVEHPGCPNRRTA